jgi:hypothetical protein
VGARIADLLTQQPDRSQRAVPRASHVGKQGIYESDGIPDLVISVNLANYPPATSGSYELRALGSNVYQADGQTLIWRGDGVRFHQHRRGVR